MAIQVEVWGDYAPHTGRDDEVIGQDSAKRKFQSTRPIRGATLVPVRMIRRQRISIHAPHTGRDGRSSHDGGDPGLFQSTRPIRGATAKMHNLCSAFLQ